MLIILLLALLYTIKPIATTNFILSAPSELNLTYLAIEVFSKTIFVFLTMIIIENRANVTSMEGMGLIFSLMSEILYFNACDRFKELKET